MMMKIIVDKFSRLFVGILFIFSGLVKINDPVGTKIKLEEYFEVFSSDFGSFFEIFIPYALPIAFFVIILELVLGIALLINFKMSWTMIFVLSLMCFFTFLTFYSAYFNKVTDCGCFGDAIPLTPWQSFYKDIILMIFVLHLFWYRKTYQSFFLDYYNYSIVFFTVFMSMFVGVIAIRHLPFIDFRPYKVGDNIQQNMIASEEPIIEYFFEKNGERINSFNFKPLSNGYKYVDSKILNEKKSTPKITDYQIFGIDGNDYTKETFIGVKLLIIFYDASFYDINKINKLKSLVDGMDQSIKPMILTSAGDVAFKTYTEQFEFGIPYYFTDATVLKAMIRSSPGLILMNDGTVLEKWHYNNIPAVEEINAYF